MFVLGVNGHVYAHTVRSVSQTSQGQVMMRMSTGIRDNRDVRANESESAA